MRQQVPGPEPLKHQTWESAQGETSSLTALHVSLGLFSGSRREGRGAEEESQIAGSLLYLLAFSFYCWYYDHLLFMF